MTAHTLTDKELEKIERKIAQIYKESEKSIQKKAEEYFAKFEKADAEKLKLVKEGKLTEGQYAHWRRGKLMYGKRYKAMREDISRKLLELNQSATEYINGELPSVYAMNYNALERDVKGIEGYSFTLTDADTVKHLATADKSLLPYKKIDARKDIPWNMRNINNQVLQGILNGDSIPNIAKRIMHVQEMNKDASLRTARTLVTGAENKGRLDSYQTAQDEGIILEKQWLASGGKHTRTRDWHAELDGKTRPIDKPFSNSVGLIMYPGDPGAHPANVYNCRCTLVANVKGFKKVKYGK